jgi:hypothetical protein
VRIDYRTPRSLPARSSHDREDVAISIVPLSF